MRRLALVLLVAIVPATFADENEAEKLFHAMETKVRSSKELHLVFDGVTSFDESKIQYHGSFDRADRTKFRLVLEAAGDASTVKRMTVSDGTAIYSNLGSEFVLQVPPEADDVDRAVGLCARAGVSFFANTLRAGPPKAKELDLDAVLKAAQFSLGGREKIGSHEGQIVDYTLAFSSGSVKARVWIDTTTQLPLRYSVTTKATLRGAVVDVQDYRVCTVDAKVDPTVFTLPRTK